MQNCVLGRRLLASSVWIAVVGVLVPFTASAQTPPTPTTTFTNVSDTLWGTAANWDNGIPDTGSNGDALIAAGQTAAYSQSIQGDANFGTLTLAAGATLQNAITTASTYMSGKSVYFNDGAIFQISSGSYNSSATFRLVPGATGTFQGSANMIQGSVIGAGNLNVVLSGNLEYRANGNNLTGDLTFTSNNTSGRRVGPSRFSGTSVFGTGTATISDNVYLWGTTNGSNSNSGTKLNGLDTLKLLGDTGGVADAKFNLRGVSPTIGNLVVESVGTRTGTSPLLRSGASTATASFLTVTDTVTFQGTASTVEIDDAQTTPSGNSILAGNMTFAGTGDWTIIGDGRIGLGTSATITTTNNASIANALSGTNGFTKAGNGALTLTGDLSALTGNIDVTAGDLLVSGALSSMSVGDGAQLTIGTAGTAGDVLTLGAGGLTLASNSTINWTLGTTVDQYDTIVSAGALDLAGIGNITIDGTTLGYTPGIGDSFTLFNGTVTNFDPSKFVLNLPTPSAGSWEIQEGSLQLVVVPEPAGILLAGVGLAGLFMYRNRRSISTVRPRVHS